jgi:hypothetical protein
LSEEKIDRRAHWIQLLVTGLVAATVWCVKLEMNLSQLETDFKQYKRDMKDTVKEYDNRLDDLDHRVIHLEDRTH